jgi:ABC-2 type transport system ATP-binding protein
MMVRFAFAVMVQADADIMLIDEVLAVGDASFAQKCMDVFHERRRAGKTVVLVTHDMSTVQSLCHRALVLHDGEPVFVGDPEEAAMRYLQLNFTGATEAAGATGPVTIDRNARVLHARLRDAAGETVENVSQVDPILVDIELEAVRPLEDPLFVINILNADGVVVCEFLRPLEGSVGRGQRVRLAGEIENRLVAGRHDLDCWIREDRSRDGMTVQAMRLLSFVVFGTGARHGLVSLEADIEPVVLPERGA